MKGLKKIFFFTLALALVLALTACGECKHTDKDNDGVCDKCEEEIVLIAKDVVLIDKTGQPTFQIVLADDIDPNVRLEVQNYVEDFLDDADIEIEVVKDVEDSIQDCEVLIGNVKTRGLKYLHDEHSLGYKGYVIKIVDEKVVINGGSGDAIIEALEIFVEEILMFDGEEYWEEIIMTPDMQVNEPQSDYKITSLKLAGEDMRGYTIAVNKRLSYQLDAAENLQTSLYKQTGYWFEIVDLEDADKSIVFKSIPKVYSDESFKMSVSENQLVIECAFDNKLSGTITAFLTSNVYGKTGEINFEGAIYKKDISYVTYAEFGATNNGKSGNDFQAMYDAHVFANISGQKVIVEGSPTYYISTPIANGQVASIPIKTDVDWGNMTLYIDDAYLDLHNEAHNEYWGSIFKVEPTTPGYDIFKGLESVEIKTTTTKIDLGLGKKALIIPYDGTHKIYRRRNYATHEGANQHEPIVIDANGMIIENSEPMFDYTTVSRIHVYIIDEETLTINGGTIRTIACNESIYSPDGNLNKTRDVSVGRNIGVARSNVIIKNMKHYVEGEFTLYDQMHNDKTGVAYTGFVYPTNVTNVTVEDCVFSGRRCYTKPSNKGGGGTTGTYDIGAATSNNVIFKNCIQHNFWVKINDDGSFSDSEVGAIGALLSKEMAPSTWGGKQMFWGICSTNYCKNFQYIGSTLSRFDAHCGMNHGKIIDSNVCGISLTGGGNMIIENSNIYARDASLLDLRNDYGYVWNGNIKIKDTRAYLTVNDDKAPCIINYGYTNWNFGYPCVFPNFELDNVSFFDRSTLEPFDEGTEVRLIGGDILSKEPGIHLGTLVSNVSTYSPYYCYTDENGNGYVDDYDMNKDGIAESEGDLVYDSSKASLYTGGIQDAGSMKNVNKIIPPSYIKVLNNNGADTDGDGVGDTGGFKFVVTKTDDDTGVSNGGFFGATKFYYTADKYYTGTGMTTDADDSTFLFKN